MPQQEAPRPECPDVLLVQAERYEERAMRYGNHKINWLAGAAVAELIGFAPEMLSHAPINGYEAASIVIGVFAGVCAAVDWQKQRYASSLANEAREQWIEDISRAR